MVLNRLLVDELARRALPEGGYADRPRGQFRSDSTAWGILASGALASTQNGLERHRSRLAQEQREDGRVRLSPQHPESYWPTALAILAWQGSSSSQAAHDRAVRFLLETTGLHFQRKPNDIVRHDTSLKGWPWIENSHSWVEPTAVSVLALRSAGHVQHSRVQEAIRMMLDRQLPHGGWNVASTIVFGKELTPAPEGSGAALASLAGLVEEPEVGRSLDYLQGEVERLKTPISLGWSLIGLAAWGRWPRTGAGLLERCLANQSRYGDYETSSLCLLALGLLAGDHKAHSPFFVHRPATPASVVASS
jgi:hypothetical protein